MEMLYDPKMITAEIKASLSQVGVLMDTPQRAGSYVLVDDRDLLAASRIEGLEILPIAQAYRKYDWLKREYAWKLIDPEKDEVTRNCFQQPEESGFFIRVQKGVVVEEPFQSALCMAKNQSVQALHNIIILEEGAQLHLITGCVTESSIETGEHQGITEAYIGKNANLTNTMVHSWGPQVIVRPRSATRVEAGGTFNSNYVSLRTAKFVETNPVTWLVGDGASARYQSVILGAAGSTIQTGGVVYLEGEKSSAELTHRAVCTGGVIEQAGLLVGNARGCRAHVDCAGLLVDPGEKGYIESTPALRALNPEANMSHEASIGRIAPAQVEYLMSRGMRESEAVAMIIRGFLNAQIAGLGKELDNRINEIAEMAAAAQ